MHSAAAHSYDSGSFADYSSAHRGGAGGGGGSVMSGGQQSWSVVSGDHATNASSVDEAYRRLGQRLSRWAHGDDPSRRRPPLRQSRLGGTPFSCFAPLQLDDSETSANMVGAQNQSSTKQPNEEEGEEPQQRIAKVPKMRYNDHGDHSQRSSSENLLKKLTFHARESFRQWKAQDQEATKAAATAGKNKKRSSPRQHRQQQQHQQQQQQHHSFHQRVDLTPQQQALSQLALECGDSSGSSGMPFNNHNSHYWKKQGRHHHHHQHAHKLSGAAPEGLLSAVMERSSSRSTSCTDNASLNSQSVAAASAASVSTRASSSIANISSGGRIRGKCLTVPCEPVANDGLDNVDGNLIVYENDKIAVDRKQIHTLDNTDDQHPPRSMAFVIVSVLGQGTFAQVFKCQHIQSGEMVALKIVKNKPAYTRQAAVEIDVFQALAASSSNNNKNSDNQSNHNGINADECSLASLSNASSSKKQPAACGEHMVNLICYFVYRSHLCLVFELLGWNLYEVLKRRQFRGLPLTTVRTLVKQAVEGIRELAKRSIVHCDLKPENVLLLSDDDVESVVHAGEGKQRQIHIDKHSIKQMAPAAKPTKTSSNNNEETKNETDADTPNNPQKKLSSSSHDTCNTSSTVQSSKISSNCQSSSSFSSRSTMNRAGTTATQPSVSKQSIKLIDFGSACFEGYSAHTYIQSRFYRSPEVLIGLPYDSAIDMWSLGCIAAELYLGLPILPGVHEHDQLGRICEMVSDIPDWMLDQGSKSPKYFVKFVPRHENNTPCRTPSPAVGALTATSSVPPPKPPQWRIKTQQEYIQSLSQSEIRKKGGMAKLQKQPANRYFKRKKLSDIIMLHGQNSSGEEKELLETFVHFLHGILDPDPWKRWTAFQVAQHPFLAGGKAQRRAKQEAATVDLHEENLANREFEIYWVPPWDAGICRRRLLNVQNIREKQNALRRSFNQSRPHGTKHQDGGVGQHSATSVIDNSPLGYPRLEPDSPPTMIPGRSPSYGRQPAVYSGLSASLGSGIPAQAGAKLGQQEGAAISGVMPSSPQRRYEADFSQSGMMNDPHYAQHMMGPPSNGHQYVPVGARSFSSVGYDGNSNSLPPAEADFGHALQRPGVFPGMGCESSSVNMRMQPPAQQPPPPKPQMPQQPYGRMTYSPQHQLPGQMSSAHLPRSSSGANSSSRRRHTMEAGTAAGSHDGYDVYGASPYAANGSGGLQPPSLLSEQLAPSQSHGMYHFSDHMPNDMYNNPQPQPHAHQQQQQQHVHRQYQHQMRANEYMGHNTQQAPLGYNMSPYGTTGNGYYFVTSSAGGTTPMMMPPASMGVPPNAPMGSFGSHTDNSGMQGYGVVPPQYHAGNQISSSSSFDDNLSPAMAGIHHQRRAPRSNHRTYMGGMSM